MMRCPRFIYRAPATLAEAAAILAGEGPDAMLLAGGTDLVPNLKRRQQTPKVVVSLRRITPLREAAAAGAATRLGSMLTLSEVISEASGGARGALRKAAAQVATPHLRNMGTLGGNLCLDTRCNYYDQNFEWRSAIDFCMKKDGHVCWVAPGSSRCWAVTSTDTAPALMALGAEAILHSAGGERMLSLADFYRDDGIAYLAKRPEEIVAGVLLPVAAPDEASTYWKLRRRGAFDFPVLSVAAWIRRDQGGVVRDARVILGSVASRPIAADAGSLLGTSLGDEAIEAAAEAGARLAKPLDNTDFALGWRKKAAHSLIAGALRELRGDAPSTLGPFARRAAVLVPAG